MKKIMFLGGSKQQTLAIKHAVSKGYKTVLCDFLADNPGQQWVDSYYCVSTTDKAAILKIAQNEKVDAVIAYASDPAAPSAAYVAEHLGLPTNPYKSVELLTNKDKFRRFLEEHNFFTPKAKGYNSIDEAKKDIENYKFPVILKPVDSSGSKGVSKLNTIEELELKANYALKFSRVKRFIIEEFVEMNGYQVAGDGFSVDGKLVFRCFGNDHFILHGLNPFIPISASFPYCMSSELQKKIHDEIQRLFNLLEIKTGAYNFDIRIDNKENVYLMEVGPRNGGNFIPQVIKYATGVDLLDYTLKAALGENCEDLRATEITGFWSYFAIHSDKKGTLKEISINEEVLENNIVETHINYKAGETIPAFIGSNDTIGILLMKFNSEKEMLEMMDYSEKWIEVIIN